MKFAINLLVFSIFWATTLIAFGDDRENILQVLENIPGQFEDFTCEYEGKSIYPPIRMQPGREDEVYDQFTGRFIYCKNDRIFLDLFHRMHKSPSVYRETLATIRGQTTEYSRTIDVPGSRGTISNATYEEYDHDGSFGKIFLLPVLKSWLRYSDAGMQRLDNELINGVDCVVVEFFFKDKPELCKFRFWLDMSRSGFPVQRADRRESKLRFFYHDFKFQSFAVASGKSYLLPIAGTVDSFFDDVNGKLVYLDQPVNTETYEANLSTIKINRHPDDREFSVTLQRGTAVMEKLRKMEYEFGKDNRPAPQSPTEAEERLQKLLADARTQEVDINKGSAGWTVVATSLSWLPWTVASIVVVVLGVVLVRRGR